MDRAPEDRMPAYRARVAARTHETVPAAHTDEVAATGDTWLEPVSLRRPARRPGYLLWHMSIHISAAPRAAALVAAHSRTIQAMLDWSEWRPAPPRTRSRSVCVGAYQHLLYLGV